MRQLICHGWLVDVGGESVGVGDGEGSECLFPTVDAAPHNAMTHRLTGRSILITAHRPSTIENADQTTRLDNGRIAAIHHHCETRAEPA